MKIISFIKEWILIFAILAGIAAYFLFINIPFLEQYNKEADAALSVVQPLLIFTMLFLTFCRIDTSGLKVHKWHLPVLALQGGLFAAIGFVLVMMPSSGLRVVLEGAMLCLICPTATASAIITKKLGGSMENITAYIILINLLCALLVPSLVPFVHPNPELNFFTAFMLILSKVFPLLLFPLFLAMFLRKIVPKVVRKISEYQNLPFYLWSVALALAMTVTTRSIVHTTVSLSTQMWLVVISLLCCILQFWLGRKIGEQFDDKITAGQAFGQKNTVFAIWMGTTFFTPVTAIVGGFYSIWHNVFNSWQLHKVHQEKKPGDIAMQCRRVEN